MKDQLVSRISAMEKQAQEKRKAAAEIIQLPSCHEEERVSPSWALRSALFGIVRRGRRPYLQRTQLAAWEGTRIMYSGPRLDQGDLDVWLQVLELAKQAHSPAQIEFTAYAFLKALGRSPKGKSHHERLFMSLERMVACAMTVSSYSFDYVGSLIDEFYRDQRTGRYVVKLNPKLAVLFADGHTRLDQRIRRRLRTDFAKWLYGYITSHRATPASPHRIGLYKLKELCGSETEELAKFRQQVKQALGELERVGLVANWRFTEGNALEFIRSTPQQLLNY